jgi:NDP-sugar pyrophosphorylase family protein
LATKPIQAVILAGGLGTRLGSLRRDMPKPMMSVAGKPYLEHQLRRLHKQGITNILLLTGYLGEQIQAYFGDGSDFGLTIGYSREEIPMGTGGGLRDAANLLDERFLLIYGDSYLPIDYADVWRALLASQGRGLMVVYDNTLADTSVRNNVAIDGPLVTRYDKAAGNDPELRYVEAGILAFHRSIVELIPPQGPVSLEERVFPVLIADGQMTAYVTTQRFYDIGTPERLRVIEEVLTHDHHPDALPN